ncbi:MAG: hypothetical protein GY799_12305 [Desulfobulbaceae bacterium]|nr:hypothetical protein [Desulfobulbaceae bacterium]
MEFQKKTIINFEVNGVKCSVGDVISLPEWMSVEIMQDGEISRLYVGTPEHGPIASYDTSDDKWHPLWSKGNYGKNFTSGGNWYAPSRKQCEGYSTLLGAIKAKPIWGFMPKSEAHRNRDFIINKLFGSNYGYENG